MGLVPTAPSVPAPATGTRSTTNNVTVNVPTGDPTAIAKAVDERSQYHLSNTKDDQ